MQNRHLEREQYFKEQSLVTERYVIPFINSVLPINDTVKIAEIGCGEAGNMLPFLELGCKVVGIDLAPNKIENGKRIYADHPLKDNLSLIAQDVYTVTSAQVNNLDLIFMRDTLEHIPDQERLLKHLSSFLKPGGMIFLGFPPWRMPFGGHQQICENKFISLIPYTHLLPGWLYLGLLKLAGESKAKITGLQEIIDTRMSIQRFLSIIKRSDYQIVKRNFYLVNPNYEIKFKLKKRALPVWMDIPYLRDFYTTTVYFMIQKKR
ncbi:MAG: class I SAM-dependent methyltransferase [Bacteroidales bacterium]